MTELVACCTVYVPMIDYSFLIPVNGGNESAYLHPYPSLQFPRGEHRKTTCERRGSAEFLKSIAKWKINCSDHHNT